jgi:hypothetical protein
MLCLYQDKIIVALNCVDCVALSAHICAVLIGDGLLSSNEHTHQYVTYIHTVTCISDYRRGLDSRIDLLTAYRS